MAAGGAVPLERLERALEEQRQAEAALLAALCRREDSIAALCDRQPLPQEPGEPHRQALEAQLAEASRLAQELQQKLAAEKSLRSEQVEELRLQNEELKAKIASLEEQLKKEEEKHEGVVKSLEQKAMLDKESLMKEMEQRVEALATETHRRMSETTQQVIQENVALRAQLGRLNSYNRDLLKDNEELQAVMRDLKIQVDLLKDREKEMARRMVCNRKVISMLTTLCEMLQGLGDEVAWKKVQCQLEQLKEAAAVLRCEEEDSRATVRKMMSEQQCQPGASEEMGLMGSVENILSKGRANSRDPRERPSERMGKSQHWAKLRNRLMMQELSESPAAGLLLALKDSKTHELNTPKSSSSQVHPALPPGAFPGISNKAPSKMQLLVSHLMHTLRGSGHLPGLPTPAPPEPLPQPEGETPGRAGGTLGGAFCLPTLTPTPLEASLQPGLEEQGQEH